MSDYDTSQEARESQGSQQGVSGVPPVATLALLGKNGPVDDARDEVQEAVRPVAPARPRARRKERWVLIGDDEYYENFQLRVWVNYPQSLEDEMKSGDEDRANAALRQIVLEHNGWLDIDGNEYPQADDPAFWSGPKSIPNELLRTIITIIHLEASKLPNSLIRKATSTSNT